MRGHDTLMSHSKDDWGTPQWLFLLLNAEFHFEVDVAAHSMNTLCPKYFSPSDDALTQPWWGTCWMNPPYSHAKAFMKKAKEEAKAYRATTVCLVPARTDTAWWWNTARFGEIRFIQNRLRFVGSANGAPFPSAVVILRPGLPPNQPVLHWINATEERREWEKKYREFA